MAGAQPGQFGVGLGGSVIGGLYGSSYPAAAVPAASGIPEGPSTITQQAFGVPGSGAGQGPGVKAAGIGTFALAALAFIWWSLPK